MLSDKKEGTGETRSRTPNSKEFLDYISSGWQDSPVQKITAAPAADFAKVRRDAVAQAFSNQVIVIAAGAPKTGVTIHYVDVGVDTGEVIVQAEVAIEAGDTEQILHERIKSVEHELLGSTIEQLAYKQKPVLKVES
jgi:hypothetical protein